MATREQIGAAFIQVTAEGLGKVQSDLAKLPPALKAVDGQASLAGASGKRLGADISSAGQQANQARGTFAALVAGIKGLAGLAVGDKLGNDLAGAGKAADQARGSVGKAADQARGSVGKAMAGIAAEASQAAGKLSMSLAPALGKIGAGAGLGKVQADLDKLGQAGQAAGKKLAGLAVGPKLGNDLADTAKAAEGLGQTGQAAGKKLGEGVAGAGKAADQARGTFAALVAGIKGLAGLAVGPKLGNDLADTAKAAEGLGQTGQAAGKKLGEGVAGAGKQADQARGTFAALVAGIKGLAGLAVGPKLGNDLADTAKAAEGLGQTGQAAGKKLGEGVAGAGKQADQARGTFAALVAGIKGLAGLAVGPKLAEGIAGAGKAADQAADKLSALANLQKQLNSTPLSIALEVDKSRAGFIDQLKKDIDGFPRNVKIAFVAEKIQSVDDEIAKLKTELAKVPNNKEIKAKLTVAQSVKGDLEKQLSSIKAPDFSGLIPSFKAVAAGLGNIAAGLEKVGAVGLRVFGGLSAAVVGFGKTADPVGFEQLQGTIGALSVQIGSIFIPILNQVNDSLKVVLDWFRALSDEQKQSILSWVKVTLAVAAVVAIVPKLVAAFRAVQVAVAVLGTEVGIATAGIVPLIGLAVALGFSLYKMASSADEAGDTASGLAGIWKALQGVFATVWTALQPVIRGFNLGMDAIAKAVLAVMPTILSFGETVTAGIDRMVSAVGPMLARFGEFMASTGTYIGQLIKLIVPPLVKLGELVVNYLVDSFVKFAEIVTPIFDLVASVTEEWQGIVADAFDAVGVVIDAFVDILDLFGAKNDSVFNGIKNVVQSLVPIFKAVFSVIMDMIQGAIKSIIFLAAALKSIASGNIRGAAQAGMDAVSEFEARSQKRKEEREEAKSKVTAAPEAKPATEAKTKTDSFAPKASPKIEFTGIAEAWKKAQQAVTGGENSAEQEQLRLMQEAARKKDEELEILKAIRDKEPAGAFA